ncbi:MAB_1171c family putative transporter [Rhodococcus sp. NPDC057014]|uniref:MAB_1171c family putative transporter n=1 Tax=Rhodococcus sp. NPDC057014 TaxID=3346000 RepID=UPI003642992A
MYEPPTYVSWPLLAVVWGTTLLRVALVRSTVAERRMNAALVFASLSLVLQRSLAQHWLDLWFGHGFANTLSNVCIILTAASLISLFSAWALGPARLPRIHVVSLSVGLVAGAILIALSAPARSRGVAIADEGGWLFAAYCITYAVPILAVAVLNLWISLKAVRSATPGHERRVFLAVIALSLFEVFDMGVVMTTGVVNAVSEDNALTESHSDSGAFIRVLVVSAGAIISAGPAIRALGHRWRSRRVTRRLQPMWRTLTGAVPEVVLELRPADRRALSARGRLDRMSVEIRDAIMVLDRHVVFELGDHTGSAPPVVTAARLHLACLARSAGHRAHGTGGTTDRFVTDVGGEPWELARLADHWKDGERVAAALWARRLPQFGGPEDPSARVPAQV